MHFFPFSFEPPNEEEQAEMRAAHERHQMAIDDFRHGFQRLFSELDQDQLRTLRTMLHILSEQTPNLNASGWEGMISWELKARFNICVSCGVNHEEEFADPAASQKEEVTPDQPLPIFKEVEMTEQELMKQYHLDDLRIEGTGELVGFACTGIYGAPGPCGMSYPSIQDRMLKDPEECSGCFRRMAQG